jgi:hypothetical protein
VTSIRVPDLFADGVLATRLCFVAYVVVAALAIAGAVLRSRRLRRAHSTAENPPRERFAPPYVDAAIAWSPVLARLSDVTTIGLALAWWRHRSDPATIDDGLPWIVLALAISVATRLPVSRLDRSRAYVLAGRASPTETERVARDAIVFSVSLIAAAVLVRFDRWTQSTTTDHEFEPFALIALLAIARGLAGIVHGRWVLATARWLRA